MDVPAVVKEYEEFITEVKITNTSNDIQKLFSIDVGDDYLKGISLVKTEPNFTESMHVPLDNSVSYSFKKEIGPRESITIDLHWKATSQGEFMDEIDFCINSDFNFTSKYVNSVVGDTIGNNKSPKHETRTNKKSEEIVEERSNTELLKVDAIAISKEIGENEIAAELKYMGKEIIVNNCTVLGTEKNYDGYFLKVKTIDEWEVGKHEFYFNTNQLENLSNLKKGDIVNVSGVVSNFRQWGDAGELVMKDCMIVK